MKEIIVSLKNQKLMRKSKRKHLLFALLALLSIGFYACYDGEDWGGQSGTHRVSPRKRNKQLTTSVARRWSLSVHVLAAMMRCPP